MTLFAIINSEQMGDDIIAFEGPKKFCLLANKCFFPFKRYDIVPFLLITSNKEFDLFLPISLFAIRTSIQYLTSALKRRRLFYILKFSEAYFKIYFLNKFFFCFKISTIFPH